MRWDIVTFTVSVKVLKKDERRKLVRNLTMKTLPPRRMLSQRGRSQKNKRIKKTRRWKNKVGRDRIRMSEYVTLSTGKSEIPEILVVSKRPARKRRRFARAPIKRRNGSRERCLGESQEGSSEETTPVAEIEDSESQEGEFQESKLEDSIFFTRNEKRNFKKPHERREM